MRRINAWRALAVGTVACLGIVAIVGSTNGQRTRLVWNGSASVPVGLYWVQPVERLARGDLVLAELSGSVRELAAARGYLPSNIPFVKQIAALSGDTVCASNEAISINGQVAAQRLAQDRDGRPMPGWQGCRTLERDEIFLLMSDVPASFDGRYFGVTNMGAIRGRLVTLWTP